MPKRALAEFVVVTRQPVSQVPDSRTALPAPRSNLAPCNRNPATDRTGTVAAHGAGERGAEPRPVRRRGRPGRTRVIVAAYLVALTAVTAVAAATLAAAFASALKAPERASARRNDPEARGAAGAGKGTRR